MAIIYMGELVDGEFTDVSMVWDGPDYMAVSLVNMLSKEIPCKDFYWNHGYPVPANTVPVIVQVRQPHPWSPGWWRYSRPSLLHLTKDELDYVWSKVETGYMRYSVIGEGVAERRLKEEQTQWDQDNPRG